MLVVDVFVALLLVFVACVALITPTSLVGRVFFAALLGGSALIILTQSWVIYG